MLQGWFLVLISLAYVGLLFAIAYYGDKQGRSQLTPTRKPLVYSLSLAVYCTSWTFYGAVGQAATGGWVYISIFLGPALMFLFASGLIRKIISVSKRQNITSIADFIASRYGKTQSLAVMVTLIALVGTLPYIALQLKAVSMAYNVVTAYPEPVQSGAIHIWNDTALYVALVMALFAILFGTRHIDATEHHEGMMLAIAFESIVKLAAFLLVGAYITYGMFDGFNDLARHSQFYLDLDQHLKYDALKSGFLAQMLLAMLAIICLPRQFHVAVVENTHPDNTRYARWLFPLYLAAIALFVLPVATAGLVIFPGDLIEPDTFVLTLPMEAEQNLLTLLAFIGGFSAATSMVIVATVAISTMVSNDIVIPLLLKYRWGAQAQHAQSHGQTVLYIRRATIVVVVLLAYISYRGVAEFNSLASTGLLSFAAAAQLGPAIIGGMYWKRGNRYGVMAGLGIGFLMWGYTLLLPSLINAGWLPTGYLQEGLFGIAWLSPQAMFGLHDLDFLSHGVLLSLGANLTAYIIVSKLTKQRVIDRIQASIFIDSSDTDTPKISRPWQGSTRVGDLQTLCERFMGKEQTERAFSDYARQQNRPPFSKDERASIEVIRFTERLLAGVLGASSARIVINSALAGKEIQISDVISIVDEASQVLEFNRALLQATIENINQGLSVVDQNLRLVVWNQRYLDLFKFPDNMVKVGQPMEVIFRYNAQNGEYGPGDPEEQVQLLLENLRQGQPHRYQRYRSDGTVLEIQGNPMPGGGFVYTYQDITQQKQTEEALIQSEKNIRVYTDNIPAQIAYFDTEQRYLFTNKAYEEAMQVERNEAIGRPAYEVLTPEQYALRKPHIEAALSGQRRTFEIEHQNAGGGTSYELVTYTPHFSDHGHILGFFALSQDITERRQAEIALQETNEHLEERVRERTLELSKLNEALLKENQVRARAEQELRQAKLQAEQANQSKTRFLAAASHDLLQPLNAARLFASALAQQEVDEKIHSQIRNIDGSLKAAEELLSTLLDISKLDAGALAPNISEFSLQDIFKPLTAEFSVLAKERGLQLEVVPCKQSTRSDSQMLRRIVQNFLSNAIRYTPRGKVLLGCRRQGQQLRIEVWDTGVGIPENKLKEVFEEFRRLHPQEKRSEKGLGLGLAIADRMARILEHRIDVRSWPGKGTVFSVTVPLLTRQPQAQPAAQAAPRRRSALSNNLAGLKVLCIDNEPMILEGMQALLGGWACEVYTATTIDSAQAVLAKLDGAPDIILADYHLDNDVTGVTALNELHKHWEEPVPSIVITADRTDEIADEVRGHGYQYLQKPVKPAALRALMTRMLQASRAVRA